MKYTVDVEPIPYTTIILHCLKYPESGIIGLLIGDRKENKIQVSECVPLCHESTPLAPSLEIALSLVHSKHNNRLVGVYFSNEYLDENINQYASRIADRISSVTSLPSIMVQAINKNLGASNDIDRIIAYEKDTDGWKQTKLIKRGSRFLDALQEVIATKIYRDVNDFENHLDNPEHDFYNVELSEKVGQSLEI